MLCWSVCASYANFAKETAAKSKADAKEAAKDAARRAAMARSATDAIDLLKDMVPKLQEYVRGVPDSDAYTKQSCALLLEKASEMFRQATGSLFDGSAFEHDVKAVRQVVAEIAAKTRTACPHRYPHPIPNAVSACGHNRIPNRSVSLTACLQLLCASKDSSEAMNVR